MYKIVISAYNEESIIYKTLKSNLKHSSEIIVIDDCSTDNTWDEINRFYADFPKSKIKKIRMKKNGKKILSIRSVIQNLSPSTKYIILIDADSTLTASRENIVKSIQKLEENNFGAGAFRIDVKNKESILGNIFDIEAHIREFLNLFTSKCKKLRCIPGGGSLFKRDVLENILTNHSGEYYGEDLETTAILIENKHTVGYFPNIIVKTLVPSNIFDMIRQRIRWEAGVLRVYFRKRNFYINNLLKIDRHALLWMLEVISWVLLPLIFYNLFINPNLLPFSYLSSVSYIVMLSNGIKNKGSPLILIYPIFNLVVILISRIIAIGWLIKYYLKR